MSPAAKRKPEPIEDARDLIARNIEGDYPGVSIGHDLYGWTATRDGKVVCRSQSSPGLLALLPFYLGD